MGDFIRMCSDFFDTVFSVLLNVLESTGAVVVALFNIFVGLTTSITFFPSFIGGLMIASLSMIILLRIIGR